jgi:hypothetical protein
MTQSTDQSRTCTDAPQVSEVLRPVGIPLTPLHLAPRPAEPTQRLTARPLGHDLDPYKVPETVEPTAVAPAYTPPPPFRAPLGRNLFDDELRPASWAAFGDGPGAA